jgi:5,10-methylenetetrahydromethanopterin reductase
MKKIRFGVGLFPSQPVQEMVGLAKLAEDLGFDNVWIGDSQMLFRDAYLNFGPIAQATGRVTLGNGVTNPITRNIAVTAGAMLTLDELSKGRAVLGIGTGDSSLETVGLKPAKLAELEQKIQVFRDLTAGKEVDFGGGVKSHLHFASQGRPPIPVYIAASGPKILKLSGKIADGSIVLAGLAPEYLNAALDAIAAGAAEIGRELKWNTPANQGGFEAVCWTPCSIQADGQAAREAVKTHVARVLKRPLPFELNEADKIIQKKIYEHYDYAEHLQAGSEHGNLVPDYMVEKFAIAGNAGECREQVLRLMQSERVGQIAIIPHTHNPADRAKVLQAFASEVIHKVQ